MSITFGQNELCLSTQEFKIVVLGSSTSAGTGASTSDSAWVSRYRNFLQDLNPNNEVINLGVGGYNTYRIMRTRYIPPAGRPNPDPLRNITTAINEAPDAIIVNMPSNDVAAGYSLVEQMDNFDSIVEIANVNNIPIWICTTQPRNFSNQNQLDDQWAAKDSIYAHFNPRIIDFWTIIAESNYTINPIYNSGDGIHLNDQGHGLLFQRVFDAHIIDSLYTPAVSPDFAILDVLADMTACGDSLTSFNLVVGNVGLEDLNPTAVYFNSVNNSTGSSFIDSVILLNGLTACSFDTISFVTNTCQEGIYAISGSVSNVSDTSLLNNNITIDVYSSGYPTLLVFNDTLCDSGLASLSAMAAISDTIFWYSSPTDTISIGSGSTLATSFIDTTTNFYAESVRGHLFYIDELFTTNNSTVNWNGAMFDLIATEDLFIDSFDVKINTPGLQGIQIHYKNGSHYGSELNASAWTLLDSIDVNVIDITNPTHVPIGGLNISQGDTIGIYVHMSNPTSRLSYIPTTNEVTRSTSELTLITGTGISANYSNSYFPRDLNGGVFYHHGFRPEGDCVSDRELVVALVSEIELTSFSDTIIDVLDTLTITASGGMQFFEWFDGSNDSIIEIIASDLGLGIHYIDLIAIDSLGCEYFEEFIIGVADLVSNKELELNVNIYPNPTSGILTINSENVDDVLLTDLNGENIKIKKIDDNSFDLSDLPDGIYLLHLTVKGTSIAKQVTKISL